MPAMTDLNKLVSNLRSYIYELCGVSRLVRDAEAKQKEGCFCVSKPRLHSMVSGARHFTYNAALLVIP
jgi:hypothetical protein